MNIGDKVRAIINYMVVEWEINAIRKDIWILYDIEAGWHIYTWLRSREISPEKELLKQWIQDKINDLQFILNSIWEKNV